MVNKLHAFECELMLKKETGQAQPFILKQAVLLIAGSKVRLWHFQRNFQLQRDMAGQSVTISHGISCPIRHNQHFVNANLEKYTEVHRLFALPGPSLQVSSLDTDICDGDDSGEPQFRIMLDVTQFRPEDILIQVFEGWLLVRGQHGARMDEHGFISRCFTRQYKLPDDQLRVADLTAMLCQDGILIVESKEKWWTASD